MKIVSPVGIVVAVLLALLLVGCPSGPGQTPDTDEPDTPEPPATPMTQVFSGTFVPAPGAKDPSMGTITATITGISNDGTALSGAELAAAIAQLGAEQTFSYMLATTPKKGTTITLTGGLLDELIAPGASVMAARSEPVTDPTTVLFGTWTAAVPNKTMGTTNLTLVTTPPNGFMLTVATAAPASS